MTEGASAVEVGKRLWSGKTELALRTNEVPEISFLHCSPGRPVRLNPGIWNTHR